MRKTSEYMILSRNNSQDRRSEQDDNQLNDSMLNRLLDEMGEVSFAMRKWWGDISKKYAWEYGSNCIWEIDFNTNEIIIRKKDSSNNDGL